MIKINNLKLAFNGEELLEISNLDLNNNNQVIGLIGDNGSGKTTLAQVIAKINNEYEGHVSNDYSTRYLQQTYFKNFKDPLSGGEYAKQKIIDAFNQDCELMILDEPSVHLDADNRKYLINAIKRFKGFIILISHDRQLIEETVDEVYEIENHKLNYYSTNYETYLQEKAKQTKNKEADFKKYQREKEHLIKSIRSRNEHSKNVNRQPKRHGISDARLAKWTLQGNPSVDRNKKAITNKLEHLQEKQPVVNWDKKIFFNYGPPIKKTNIIFLENHDLWIKNGTRLAIVGKNGAGKTTLLNEIYQKYANQKDGQLHIGYLSQHLENQYNNYQVRDYIRLKTAINQNKVRNYLAQFKYKETTFYKRISELSEGEKIQLNLSILLAETWNVLLFDEPTNYLDLRTTKMLEKAIDEYLGTVIFATHDQKLIYNLQAEILDLTGLKNNV